MRRSATLAALLAVAAAAPAQDDPFAMPADGREFLAWHLHANPASSDWEYLASQLFRYYQSASYVEAERVARRMLELDPGNPEVQRFLIYLDYWLHDRIVEPQAAAERWIHSNAPLGATPDGPMSRQLAEMERFRRELIAERERRAGVERARRRARWAPLAALVLVLGFSAAMERCTRPHK
ncbi:MAG: hypothetical protein EYC70_03510 [Planctomycetota bacterium]|nr:MAG: hypothetical protein EYC70_03510 [Planctomycetota bacterium]